LLEHLGKRVLVFLACVSFANLFFLDEWDKIASRWADAALASPPHPTLAQFFGPLFIALFALSLLFRIALAIAPRLSRGLALVALLAPLNLIRINALHLERQDVIRSLGRSGAIAMFALLIALIVFAGAAALRWSYHLMRLPGALALLLAPLLPIQLAYNFWRFEHLPPPSAYQDQPSAPLVSGQATASGKANARRVVWLLFDELDQSLVFDHRPSSVQLPEFDRLRRESIYADHAESPGIYTMEAVPGMLTEKYVEHARELDPGDLLLKFAGDPHAKKWSDVRNIFDDLRGEGVNSTVLGAELPYCRAIGHSLASCDWFPSGTVSIALKRPSIPDRAWYLLRTRPFTFPWLSSTRYFRAPLFDGETRRRSRAAEAASFELMRHRAGELAVDSRFQLVFMHFPVPHLLGIYDRHTGDYSTSDSSSYLDNLALADRTLGDVRRALESAGLWDKTTLLVTSDHPLRDWIIEDAGWWNDRETASLGPVPRRYVPFLFKIPAEPPHEIHDERPWGLRLRFPLTQILAGPRM
jgi:hypothetical protein